MKLSIIILNYNVRYFLELCLQSVQEALKDIDAEIIVVDNNSIDDSCDMVKQLFPEVKLIENKDNSGFSKGNNIGVAQAKGEYICILNPDTIVAGNTFTKLLDVAEKQKNLGAIGCRLIDGKGQFLPESKRHVPVVKVAFQKMIGYSENYYVNQISEFDSGKIDVLVGAFMFMKRAVYNQVKGFDEDYFMYGEDIDLSYKIINAGFDNYYVGDTTVIHYKGESTLKDKTYAKRFYGAMQIFYKKHFKSNLFFDTIVWFGIKFATLFQNSVSVEDNKINQYILVSNMQYDKLTAVLTKPLKVVSKIGDVEPNTEIIFDANSLSYTFIIQQIITLQKNNTLTFKILSKKSNFILGSNHSKQRGAVITF